MGVKNWGLGLVAAAVISAVTASSAPVAVAETSPPAADAAFEPTYDLPASLASESVANTASADTADALDWRWACSLPIRIYYAAAPSIDNRQVLKQLEYPVEYLRGLGYDVSIVREVAYLPDYSLPVTGGDVLLIVNPTSADAKVSLASTQTSVAGESAVSAKVTVNGAHSLASDILLHEMGHAIGLDHKPGTVMAAGATDSVAFDPAETAAVDCR